MEGSSQDVIVWLEISNVFMNYFFDYVVACWELVILSQLLF